MFTSLRVFETTHNEDGSAVTQIMVRCTLADIARATNLRIEDAAFALNECGLLMKKAAGEADGEVVVVTRKLVEQVAKERNVKVPCMHLAHVLL